MKMKVSIITVTYNSKQFLPDAIRSVRMQSYGDIEHIFVDGASSDGTVDVIKSHLGRQDKFISEKDTGLYDAMNKGVQMATGDIIGILNSDDYYSHTDAIKSIVESFISTNCDILYGDVNYVEQKHPNDVVRRWNSGAYCRNYFELGFVPAHPTVFVRRELGSKFKYNLSYRLAADYDWLLRLFKFSGGYIFYYQKAFIHMRLGGATNKNIVNVLKGNIEIAKSWWINERKVPLLTLLYRRPKIKLSQYR